MENVVAQECRDRLQYQARKICCEWRKLSEHELFRLLVAENITRIWGAVNSILDTAELDLTRYEGILH